MCFQSLPLYLCSFLICPSHCLVLNYGPYLPLSSSPFLCLFILSCPSSLPSSLTPSLSPAPLPPFCFSLPHSLPPSLPPLSSFSPSLPGTCYTASCDVYSFGVVLWEMITRHKPYLAGTRDKPMAPQSVLYRVATGIYTNNSTVDRAANFHE